MRRFALLYLLMPISTGADLLELQKVDENVFAVVGPLGNRSPENLGNNATFGFVVTPEGVVLIDPGGSHQGAAHIDRMIRSVTDLPVKIVVNTGGQDHRWLGNGYFRTQGAKIIASVDAVEDQQLRHREQLIALGELLGKERLAGTDPVYADKTFDADHSFTLGGVEFTLKNLGPAHTPGDSIVYLPERRILFSGDIVYVDRLLSVGAQSNSGHWVEAFDTIAALDPVKIVPGHGGAATLAVATADTYDYLTFLRQAVADFIDSGRGVEEIGAIDQTRFRRLRNFDTLSGRNAQQVFDEMLWE